MHSDNLFTGIPAHLPDELVTRLAGGNGCRIERIVSRGHCSPPGFWYDQVEEEWVLVTAGEAVLRFEEGDQEVRLVPGDHVHIAARRRHRVEWTAPDRDTVWLAVFYRSHCSA